MTDLPCPHCATPRPIRKYGVDEFSQQGYHACCPNPYCLATGPLARTVAEARRKDAERKG